MTSRAGGLLLAAGAGRRMGTPKALVEDAGGPWLHRALDALAGGGCAGLVVVLGARAPDARALVGTWSGGPPPTVVVADDWSSGMGASLRAGLGALAATPYDVAVVTLVDLPDVGAAVVRRVLDAAGEARSTLARATYGGVPGHPVVLGADHWAAAADAAQGDRGARDLLAGDGVRRVECADLATGADVDTPPGPGTRGARNAARG